MYINGEMCSTEIGRGCEFFWRKLYEEDEMGIKFCTRERGEER